MARLVTSGFELRDNKATSNTAPDGVWVGGAVAELTIVRSGTAALNCPSGSGQAAFGFTAVTLGSDCFLRAYLYVPTGALPFASTRSTALSFNFGTVAVESDGTLTLWKEAGFITQYGSASSAITLDAWNRIDLRVNIGSGSIDQIEGRLAGVSFASASGQAITDTPITTATVGFQGSNDAAVRFVFDDVAVNDSSGASQTSWPDDSKIVLLQPISLNANGGSWTDDAAATTSAALTNAIDNSPPNGIADTTAGGGNHQVRNAGANTNLDMNLTSYTAAGVGASDTINVLTPICAVGAPVSTGAKSGSFGITSNPAITNRVFTGGSGTATFFWRGAAAGTYPSNWGWEKGTVTYAPSVTLGTSPVARLSITGGTTSRIAMCCDLGLYVDYTPAAPKSLPTPARTVRNSLLRR